MTTPAPGRADARGPAGTARAAVARGAVALVVALAVGLALLPPTIDPATGPSGTSAVPAAARSESSTGEFGACGVVPLPEHDPEEQAVRFDRAVGTGSGAFVLYHRREDDGHRGVHALDGQGHGDVDFADGGWLRADGVRALQAAADADGATSLAWQLDDRTVVVHAYSATRDRLTPDRGVAVSLPDEGRLRAVARHQGRTLLLAESLTTSTGWVLAVTDAGLDTDYATDGRTELADVTGVADLAVDGDGATLVLVDAATHAEVRRLLPSGAADAAYAGDGAARLNGAMNLAVDATADGAARVVGGSWDTVAALRPDGEFDDGYGGGGGVRVSRQDPDSDALRSAAADASGRVVFADTRSTKSVPEMTAIRLTASGQSDSGYAGTGTASVLLDPGTVAGVHVDVRPDGAAYLLSHHDAGQGRALLARLEPDGSAGAGCEAGRLTVTRVAGTDRFATAARIAENRFPSASTVYVATGTSFADALAGGPAAASDRAPLLLVTRDRVPEPTRQQLRRLRPDRIVVLGGTQVITDTVVGSLERFAPDVDRIAGTDRYATAARVARDAFPDGAERAYVATGRSFPDALAVGAFAAANGAPILLTEPTTLPRATSTALQALRPEVVVVVGGPAAVSEGVESQLRQRYRVERYAGPDRYATARRVVLRELIPDGEIAADVPLRPLAFLTTGTNFPDALAAGPAAGLAGAPLLLTRPDRLSDAARDALALVAPTGIEILGGERAVSRSVATSLTVRELTYRFNGYRPSAPFEQPARWNPCEPIRWRFNPDGAPSGGLDIVRRAVRRVGEATGIAFDYVGTTSASPDTREPQQSREGGRWAPVTVGWTDLGGGGTLGEAAPVSVDGIYVTGRIAFNVNADEVPVSFEPRSWGVVAMHEFGHLVGLAHVPGRAIMYPLAGRYPDTDFTAGDLRGFARVGRPAGCLVTPSAS